MSEIDDILRHDDINDIVSTLIKHKEKIINVIIVFSTESENPTQDESDLHWHGYGLPSNLIGLTEYAKYELLKELGIWKS